MVSPVAEKAFKDAKVPFGDADQLRGCDGRHCVRAYIEEEDVETLNEWRKDLHIGNLENKNLFVKC